MRLPTEDDGPADPDPLVVAPIDDVQAEFKEWSEDELFREAKPTFAAPIAPDGFPKENVSGAAPYEIELPDAAADCPIISLDFPMTFVRYLRLSFAWAGLPGYKEVNPVGPPRSRQPSRS